LWTILARFIAIGIFYFPLSKTGYGLDWKKYVILSYGGLRGSHSLILALVIDERYYTVEMAAKIHFYMGGVVILSLIFQSLTFNYLLDSIHLVKKNKLQAELRR
jgi:NhaP-type Na+/H+ or K+/H+ antiporter